MHSGVIAVLATLGAICLYVWLRFEWQFGVGALIALLHDVISTIGLFVLLRLDFSLTAMGQTASGTVDVTDDQVKLEILLPGMLGMLANKVKDMITQRGQILLEKK